MLTDSLVSLLRTYMAVWVPTVAAWLASYGIDLPVEPTQAVALAVLISAFYAVVRAAESRWPWVGWLLGAAKAPTYELDTLRR